MSPVEYTSMEVLGFLIEEPMTTATDLLTASVSFFAFFQLRKLNIQNTAFRYFMYYFLFIGFGTTCAAFFSHGILYITGYNMKTIGWTLSAIGIYNMENSALAFYQQEMKTKRFSWLSFAFKVQLVFFILLLIYEPTRVFEVVQINSTVGVLGAVFPFFAYLLWKTGKLGYRKVVIAFCMSFVTGIVFNAEPTIHKYFNYHDISHVLMAFSCFLLYLGGQQLAKELTSKAV